MMPSMPTLYSGDARHPCRLSTGSAYARLAPPNCRPVAPINQSRNEHLACSPRHLHPTFEPTHPDPMPRRLRHSHLKSHGIVKSP